MKKIEIKLVDWWDGGEDEEHFHREPIIKILKRRFNLVYSNNPDFIIYNHWGSKHLEYECVRIFFTGENLRADWNIDDYSLDFDLLDFGDRHLCAPLYFFWIRDLAKALGKHKNAEEFMESKSKFCGFLASNPNGDPFREKIFNAINAYKKVDSGGFWLNNINERIGNGHNYNDKRKWLENYKFNLCPENSTYPGYVTEKIIQAYASGCVPIYWGDTTLCDKKYADKRFVFNPKAFISVHDFENLDSLVEEIERLDNDESAYFEKLKEPIFIDLDYGLKLSSLPTSESSIKELIEDFSVASDIDETTIENLVEFIGKDTYIQAYLFNIRDRILDFFSNIFESPNPKRVLFSQYMKGVWEERMDYRRLSNARNKNKKFIPRPLRRFFWG